MPFVSNGGIKIHYQENGSGHPLVFLHEYAGDHRSWDWQVRTFSPYYRCVTISNRGYPPSDCPQDASAYGQDIVMADIIAVLDRLDIACAHLVGLSQGAYTALRLAMAYRKRISAVVAAAGGSGSIAAERDGFIAEALAVADLMVGTNAIPAEAMGLGPTRIQLKDKHPEVWAQAVRQFAEHPAHAAAHTLREVQVKRPPLYEFEADLAAVEAPVLLMVGDEDGSCLKVNVWLKSIMPSARLAVLPGCGHALNLEEPETFNRLVAEFVESVDEGTWRPRNPLTIAKAGVKSALGLGDSNNLVRDR